MTEQTNKKPLITGIIIFLNGEKFIEEAIESVFAQTYDNWELLLVDDGSTDGSTAIAKSYAEKYPHKVRYLEHEGHQNRGMSATRNLGFRHAKGEYIALLDADDVWLPQKLEVQLAIMDSHPESKIVCGLTQYWYSWAGNHQTTKRDFIRDVWMTPNRLYHPPQLLKLFLQKKVYPPATCSILMRRELLTEIGGFEDSFRGMYEDQAFFVKVFLNATVYVHRQVLDRYRQHPDSSCHVAINMGIYHELRNNPAHQRFLNWVEDYLSQQGVKDAEIWQALQKQLWPYQHPRLYSLLYPLQRILDMIKYRWWGIKRRIFLPPATIYRLDLKS
jgi:glycosyltransferase involved in cell wall biosynthesis